MTYQKIHDVDIGRGAVGGSTVVRADVHGSVPSEDNPGGDGAVDTGKIFLDPEEKK